MARDGQDDARYVHEVAMASFAALIHKTSHLEFSYELPNFLGHIDSTKMIPLCQVLFVTGLLSSLFKTEPSREILRIRGFLAESKAKKNPPVSGGGRA
jgi:hypothetical protein